MRSICAAAVRRSVFRPVRINFGPILLGGVVLAAGTARAQLVATPSPVNGPPMTSVGGPIQAVAMIPLAGQIAPSVAQAQFLGSFQAPAPITFVISLPLQNRAGLDQLNASLYNPQDPLYGQYLTPTQFRDQFGPSQDTLNAVLAYAQSQGFVVLGTQPSRTLVTLQGTQAQIETAFQIQLGQYQDSTGRLFHAPTSDPLIPLSMSGKIAGIVGLSDVGVYRPLLHRRKAPAAAQPRSCVYRDYVDADDLNPNTLPGTGLGSGGLSASDIRTFYNLNNSNLSGKGQVLALFELDTYYGKDIQRYELDNGISSTRTSLGLSTFIPLQDINVSGVGNNSAPGNGVGEVVLDIDMMAALAPGIDKIYVYNAVNTFANATVEYAQIANDDIAKSISTSWGAAEADNSPADMAADDAAFSQMSSQGQSIYAAAGDNGSFDSTGALAVDYPAADPYMCGVGGTTITVQTAQSNEAYKSEAVWNYNNETGMTRVSGSEVAGGGGVTGISTNKIPSYQLGAATYAANLAGSSSGISTTLRNVPDVALNASDASPFIYYQTPAGSTGNYYYVFGTSAAAPLWAGFTALVNENRALNATSPLGFPNATLYPLAPSTTTSGTGVVTTNANGLYNNYTSVLHDVTIGNNSSTKSSTLYPAGVGFDCGSGIGTFNGINLIVQLSGVLPTTQH